MAKIRDRPPIEETRKAATFLPVEPFISASYRHALKFYNERKGWSQEEIWKAIQQDVAMMEDRPEEAEDIALVAEHVNDRLIFQLQKRYGYEVEKVLSGMREIVRKEEP
jgi:ribosome-binding protein aMBF1 (putative translation factor)